MPGKRVLSVLAKPDLDMAERVPGLRAVAVLASALLLAALCVFLAQNGAGPAELIIHLGKASEKAGAEAELASYANVLSFGPADDPAARTTPGDDKVCLHFIFLNTR
jgi:hypothetical protein